jgi:hypothetical protein
LLLGGVDRLLQLVLRRVDLLVDLADTIDERRNGWACLLEDHLRLVAWGAAV